ncbi:hypothetical protein D3C85_1926760 [compost metagenome]
MERFWRVAGNQSPDGVGVRLTAMTLAPGTPPGTAEHEARKGDELLDQQAANGILAVGERLGLFGFQAVPLAL